MNEIESTVDNLRGLFERSIADGDFSYEHNHELGDFCDTLSENKSYETWAPLFFGLIEEYDEKVDLTLTSPGPLVHKLESGNKEKYREFLLASLDRKPTGTTAWMASRFSRDPSEDVQFWAQKIKDILNHPLATAGAKKIAEDV